MTTNHRIIESSNHHNFMHHALELARANLGQTWPNPSVGAVIVKNNQIAGEGATARGGRPHAEAIALTAAGENARGATMYVTLEPCSHHGKTPPCTKAIINAGIAEVVIACRDPHPEHGGGIQQLRAAGIKVIEGVCENEARELNRGFISVVERNRPYIAMKIATSSDGKIAYPPPRPSLSRGEEVKWITGQAARTHGQRLRSEFDAIVTGIGTVLADDPQMTVRIPGLENKSPVRVVLDRQGRLPANARIHPAWVLNNPNVETALTELTQKGITRLFIEAGQGINTAFLEAGLVDRVYWYKAPFAIGGGGLSALKHAHPILGYGKWTMETTENLGNDVLEVWRTL
jgi:diaminohydroxyphosphoribosylaminopyrimidine deaminase/5-amino-6-(5-phosphoribosylamino)uracil reductase